MNVRKICKQSTLNSMWKIKTNRTLKLKIRKQYQDNLKEKRKAITENENNSSSDDTLDDEDEKTFLTVILLKLLCIQSSDVLSKY